MNIEEAVRAKLLTMAAVTAVTSVIRADRLEQTDTLPAIVLTVKEDFENELSGTCALASATVNVVSLSRNRPQARDLAEAIRTNSTDPGTGLAGCDVTTGDLPFEAMLVSRQTGYDDPADNSEKGYYWVDSTYICRFTETT
jgi:hypothetical protein